MKSTHLREYEQLLARLKAARKGAGVTQQQMAKRLSQPQSFVSKYETGERRLDIVEFVQVAHALEIDPLILVDELSQALLLHRPSVPRRQSRSRLKRA